MRNRTQHGLSWLTTISDAGSTPAASTKSKYMKLKLVKLWKTSTS